MAIDKVLLNEMLDLGWFNRTPYGAANMKMKQPSNKEVRLAVGVLPIEAVEAEIAAYKGWKLSQAQAFLNVLEAKKTETQALIAALQS